MSTANEIKVLLCCRKISFLMEHQYILGDLKELAEQMCPEECGEPIDYDSKEYIKGAHDALVYLISYLESKGE